MKLDYATLISPYPLYLQGIGNIKSPTLKEIWNPKVTYFGYSIHLSLLLMDLQTYCDKINPQLSERFNSLSNEERSEINMFDLIVESTDLQEQYRIALEFFLVESVVWDNCHHSYFTYLDKDKSGKIIPVGVIHSGLWCELCDVILQRCGIERDGSDSIDESKIKSKRVLEILKKIKNGKKKNNKDKKHNNDTELPNLISKVAVMAKSINFTNIWDLTVFQFYEQFKQERANICFNISMMSVAAWGNEKKTFQGNEWYKTLN